MTRFAGTVGVLLVLVLSMAFAAANSAQRVTIDLGLFVLVRVPVTWVAFGGLFTGMFVMLVAGIHSDLRVRRILRERLAEEDREERDLVDDHQRELFPPPEAIEEVPATHMDEPLPDRDEHPPEDPQPLPGPGSWLAEESGGGGPDP